MISTAKTCKKKNSKKIYFPLLVLLLAFQKEKKSQKNIFLRILAFNKTLVRAFL
jgi:hypothetical protein